MLAWGCETVVGKWPHLQSRKVDDIVDVWVLLEHLVKRSLICDIALVEGRSLAANELDAVDDFWGGVVEVVDNDNFVVGFEEGQGCERANVAGTTKPLSISIAHDAVLKLRVEGWRGSLPGDENGSYNHCENLSYGK